MARSSIYLACCLAFVFCLRPACAAENRRPVGPLISGGSEDVISLESAPIVSVSGGGVWCSGVLISPMAVLTANHCVSGSTNGSGTNKPDSGFKFPVSIQVWSRDGSNNVTTTTYTAHNAGRVQRFGSFDRTGRQNASDFGEDLAILFLDRPGECAPGAPPCGPGPVLDKALIIHPALASPCPTSGCSGDGDGGTYNPAFGMAGFAPQDGVRRQVAYDGTFAHYPGKPSGIGQYWEHRQGGIHGNPGDSGSPLFVRKPLPNHPGQFYREVIGILSGNTSCFGLACDDDEYTDITRGAPAAWIRKVMADPIARGPVWLRMHPGHLWFGEVDYTGPCQAGDRDCDHWFDAHDNCPDVSNWEQIDTRDSGRGDACPAKPPTSVPNCRMTAQCGGGVTATCFPAAYPLDVQQDVGGRWNVVANETINNNNGILAETGSDVMAASHVFRACFSRDGLFGCAAAQTLTAPDPSICRQISAGGGGGGGGSTPPCKSNCPVRAQ